MTAARHAQRVDRRVRVVLALAGLIGCGGESPPAEELPPGAADSVVEAVSDTAADTIMARDTAR